MLYIAHRVNTIKKLESIPNQYGVEVDLRSKSSDLIIHHDPFNKGEKFDDWLKSYNHKFLIINIKEEGLEPYIFEKLDKLGISDFFFLDQSFPFIIKFSKMLSRKSSVRFSDFEDIATSVSVSDYVKWVWVDTFDKFPIDEKVIKEFTKYNFKTCICSPELHGKNPNLEIPLITQKLKSLNYKPDAICSKNIDVWENLI